MKAATTRVSAVRIPDSPTQSVAPAPVVAPSKGPWMMLFQAACNTTAGQTLPVSSLTRAITNPNEVMEIIISMAESAGEGPAA